MTPLERLKAARRIYVDMLANERSSKDTCDILRENIAALDRKIESMCGERKR